MAKLKKSSVKKTSCIKTSSNCIDWEGEDLSSIEICEGDSVTEIIEKLDKALKTIQDLLDLSDLDLKCLVSNCLNCPSPEKALGTVLQLLVQKSCKAADVVAPTVNFDEKIVALAQCFLGGFNEDGDPVTKLPHSDYTKRIAALVCNHVTAINSMQGELNTHKTKIEEIEKKIGQLGKKPTVTPKYVFPSNAPQNIDVAWETLETQFGELRDALGDPGDIVQAAAKEPTGLAQAPSLTQGAGSTMGSKQGWVLPANELSGTAAAAINNLWLTVADLRGAVKTMQDNCCKITCDSIELDFDVRLSDDRKIATLFFGQKTKIPNGFKECNAFGTRIRIFDSSGASFDKYIKVAELVSTPPSLDDDGSWGSKEIDLTNTPIDPMLDYTFTTDACITNGELTCQKCVTKIVTYKDTCSYCEFSAQSVNPHAAQDGIAVISYVEKDSTVKKFITLRPGETKIIRRAITILSVAKDGEISISSSCDAFKDALLRAESFGCYMIEYALDIIPSGAEPWQFQNTKITGLGFADEHYTRELTGNDFDGIENLFNNSTRGMFPFVDAYLRDSFTSGSSDRAEHRVYFKAPVSVGLTTYLSFSTSGFSSVKIFATPCVTTDIGGNPLCCPVVGATA